MAFWLMAFALLLPLVASANPAPTEITETLAEPGTPAEALPHPPALDAAVGFWKRVYSEVGNDGGLIHDDRYLDVVYTILHFPEGTDRSTRHERIDAARERYRLIVNELAAGRPSSDPEAKRVAALWQPHGAAALAGAADRVRFQRGQANRFQAGVARSGAWEDYIRQTLRAADVPEVLAALPHVESSFDPTAHSHAGASGLWQFTASTGRRYMQVDHVVDERLDPYLSTRAAAQLLRHNYEVTGSWPLAITAYNHGAAGMRQAVEQLGTRDIGVIAWEYRGRAFGFASRNFYAAFLAAVDVEARADELFGPVKRISPEQERVIELPDYMGARTLAEAVGVDLDVLRRFNPALGKPVWTGTKRWPRGFPLRVPRDVGAPDLQAALAAVPAMERFDIQVPDQYHKVTPGESLSVIARRYRTSVRELVMLNNVNNPHRIRAGTVLRLPGAPMEAPSAQPAVLRVPAPTPSPKPSSVSAPSTGALTVEALAAMIEAETSAADEIGMPRALGADPSNFDVAADGSIEIQPFETLGHYADWLHVSASHLRQVNGLSQKATLAVGRRLTLDFARVDRAAFELQRREFHRLLQEDFFTSYRITGTRTLAVKPGDSLWKLSLRFGDVPIWLLRQYNPDVDFVALRPGTPLIVPMVERVTDAPDAVATKDCVC
ncbi:MAG: transglycosylase SLT domain-containing protein [Pseudomonadales bacterium]|jgi:membrane-bound lytic murein transglycosylase D